MYICNIYIYIYQHIYCVHIASVRFEHSVCRGSWIAPKGEHQKLCIKSFGFK